jgi:exonuclease SbcD
MIKLLHTGDIHFDIPYHNQLDENGYPSRLKAALYAWDQLHDHTVKEKADGVVIAGDIFHIPKPSPLAIYEFARRIKKLSSFCSVYILPGNHDQTAIKGAVNSLDFFREAFENQDVHVVNENKWMLTRTKSGKLFIMHFLSWLPTIAERRVYLKEVTKDPEFLELNLKYPQVLVAHGVASGAKTGFGFDVDRVGSRHDDYYTTKELTITQPQYVALAHIHKYQILNNNPPIIYCGSLHDCDFGEANFEKGFVEFTLNEAAPDLPADFRFIPVKQLQKFTSIEAESVEEIQSYVESLSEEEKTGIIRIVSTNSAVLNENLKEIVPTAQQVQPKYENKDLDEVTAARIRDDSFQRNSSMEDAFNRHFEEHELKEDIIGALKDILHKEVEFEA